MMGMPVAGQYLAAAFLVALGLSVYGCGDTATVNEPAELGNLSSSTGTLQPPFNPATTSYTVQLSSDVSSTTITASPRVAGDIIRINNQPTTSQTVTIDSPGAEKSVSIVITDSGTGGASRSYTVRVKRDLEDNSLEALSVSTGTLAPAPFDKNTLEYTVNGFSTSVDSITISATKSDPNSVMQIGSVTVPAGTASGQATIQLGSTGSATPVSIDITRPSGSKKTYKVTINRGASGNNNLQGLTVTPGTLSFSASTTSYTVNVASTVTNVTVRPTLADTTANMTVNGQDTDSGQARPITLNGPGSNTIINIIVIAQNGSPKPYSVNVVRAALAGNNNLQGLAVSPGPLAPAFSAGTEDYTVNVGSGVANITVTPTLQDTVATMTVNGLATNSGQARSITLNGAGSNTVINIAVRAQNGSTKTYSVNVIRAALGGNNNLQSLAVSPGPLAPAFSAATEDYTVNVGSGVTQFTVTPTLQDTAATMIVNGQATTSGQARTITLNGAGSNTVINIAVTAQNGSTKTYSVNVIRAALAGNNNLQGLTVSQGTLSPTFLASRTVYTVNVGANVGSLNVTATLQDTNASMTINGQGTSSGQVRSISLNPAGQSTEIEIIVIAPNGSDKTYLITVNRGDNNLTALTVTPGTLTPAFAQNTLAYTVNVATDVTSVAVSATKSDPNAVISGSVPNSGQANIALTGAGTTTPVSITVTAPNGIAKTYTIGIIRAEASAPNPPGSAPDLTAASDSGIDDSDNITNVLTPSFTVAPLGAGETPKLYIVFPGGTIVKEGFDQGATTLTPTTPLPPGEYDISVTSTAINAAGLESLHSGALSVHIDNVPPGTP